MRELASLLWNKVLQTSLSFAGVCSGASVGSGSSPCTGVHRWPLSVVVLVLLSLSLLGLLSGTSVLLVRRSAATGHEEARGCSSSMVPTADGLLPRISCSLLFRVRSSFWMAADGGWLLWCASLRSEDRRLPVSTKKKNSRLVGPCCNFVFHQGPFHKKGVYYAYFHLIHGCILFRKKKLEFRL